MVRCLYLSRMDLHSVACLPLSTSIAPVRGSRCRAILIVMTSRPSACLGADHSISSWIGRSVCARNGRISRSEEHTSGLQSPCNLVCRLLLEKKKKIEGHYLQRNEY